MPLFSTEDPLQDTTDYPLAGHVNELRNIFKNGWIACNNWTTGTYNNGSGTGGCPTLTASFAGNATASLSVGDKVTFYDGATQIWGYIVAGSYSSPNTTVTMLLDKSVLSISSSSLTNVYYSKMSSPNLHPIWLNWTSNVGGVSAMTFGSVSLNTARFALMNSFIQFQIDFTGVTGGTASNGIAFTVPYVISNFGSYTSAGNAHGYDGVDISCYLITASSSRTIIAGRYDGGNWGLGSSRGVSGIGLYHI